MEKYFSTLRHQLMPFHTYGEAKDGGGWDTVWGRVAAGEEFRVANRSLLSGIRQPHRNIHFTTFFLALDLPNPNFFICKMGI